MAIDREKITRNAQRLAHKGQFLKAIAEYKKLLSLDPRDIRTRLKLLDLYGRAGRKKEAIDECTEVAESYADQGFYLKAIAVYKQALRIDPDNPTLYQNMGEMYVKQGLIGDALGAYKKGVEVLRRAGLGEEAEALLVRMEEMAPENAAIKIHLGELYMESGRFDAFEEILSKLILQLRGEGRTRKLLQAVESFYEKSDHHPSVLHRLAELYVELGEEQRALEVVREGLAEQPASRDLRLLGLRAHLLAGQLMDARRMALALCEEDPDDLNILEQLAAIAQARGDKDELAVTYKVMAKAYSRKGLHQKEELYYRKVIELVPDDAEARLALGEVLLEDTPPENVSTPDEGIGSLREAARGEVPADSDVTEGLAEVDLYLKYGMEEKAAAKLDELTERAPDHVETRTKLRDLCQRRGDRDGWVRQQLKIAELFLHDGRENEALRAYQAILEVDPENGDARSGVQYLKPEMAPPGGAATPAPVDGSAVEFVEVEGEEHALRIQEGQLEADGSADANLRQSLSEADFYEAQGLEDEALQILERLQRTHPNAPPVLSRLQRLGRGGAPRAEAEELEGDFVDLQAEILDETNISLGSDFEGFQDFEVSELDDIVSEFKSGIAERLDVEDFETHYNLGVAYREMGLLDDAVEEFKVAARSPDKVREAYSSMALVYQEQGKLTEARTVLQMALAAPRNSAEDRAAILFELGDLAERASDWGAALSSYQKVAELDPTHRDLTKRLQRLRGQAEA